MARISHLIAVAVLLPASLPIDAAVDKAVPQLRVEAGQHSAPVRRLAIDASGQFLLTAGDDKTARVWRLQTGEQLQVLRPPIAAGWEGRLYGAAFSPDGAVAAVAGDTGANFGADAGGRNRIYFFDRASGRMERTLDATDGPIKRLVWSSDGNYLAACSAKPAEVVVFDMRAQGKRLGGERLSGDCYGLAFHGDRLAATQFGRRLNIYAIGADGLRPVAQTDALSGDMPVSVAFSPTGAQLAVGYQDARASIDVFDASGTARLQKITTLAMRGIDYGNLGNVAWSRSGQWLYAAGNGYRGNYDFILRRWHTRDWQSTDFSAAANSVNDMVPTPDDGVAFAGFEGHWTILNGAGELHRIRSGIADLRGAKALRISGDGMTVQWNYRSGGEPSHFDLHERVIHSGPGMNLHGAETWRFGLTVTNWEDHYRPQLGGLQLKLDTGEASRSLAMLPDGQGFVLGADRSLRRYDTQGREAWRISAPGEARAVVPTVDGTRLVVAYTDGTLRWYRSGDGMLLLSFTPHPDGVRWVLWQPEGYYDASPGGDRMVGWHVNNGTNAAGDFYPITKFREIYHRPDMIDRYLAGWDIAAARKQADDAIVVQSLQPPPAPVSELALPPVVDLMSPAEVKTGSDRLTLQFKIRSQGDAPAEQVRVRVAGVEFDVGSQVDVGKLSGGMPVSVTVPLPPVPATVLVLARNRHGYSTAASVRVERPVAVIAQVQAQKPEAVAPPITRPAEVVAAIPIPFPSSKPVGISVPLSEIIAAPIRPMPPAPVIRLDIRPKLYLLAVGVSKYADSSLDLDLSAKDARDFADIVLRQRKASLYREVQVRVLTDKDATRVKVLEGLEWLKANVGATDTAILFLAGHGYSRPDRSYFFIPHDVDLNRLDQTAVSNAQLINLIASVKGQRLFFIDTCHAGNALGGSRFSNEISHMVSDLASEENAVIVFSSSTGKQLSLEKLEWGNGAFTKALVQGVRGAADIKDTGKITQKGLDFYISDEVPRITNGQQTPLTIIPFGTPDFPLFERLDKPAGRNPA